MRPNILFFFPDQHRGDWLPYSDEQFEKLGLDRLKIKMPTLKKLMEKGTTFTNAITPSPLCAPARACLASGKSYTTCEVPANSHDYPVDLPSFYSALKDSGYSVGGVGKFDLHKKTQWWGEDGMVDMLYEIGFTHGIDNSGKMDAAFSSQHEPRDPYMHMLEKRGWREYHSKNLRERGMSTETTDLPDELYCDNWLSQNAIDVLGEFPKDKPWFLQINFVGPHDPFDVTKDMRERWEDIDFPSPIGDAETDKYIDTDHT